MYAVQYKDYAFDNHKVSFTQMKNDFPLFANVEIAAQKDYVPEVTQERVEFRFGIQVCQTSSWTIFTIPAK